MKNLKTRELKSKFMLGSAVQPSFSTWHQDGQVESRRHGGLSAVYPPTQSLKPPN